MRFEPAKEGFYDLVLKIQNWAMATASITAKRSAHESKKEKLLTSSALAPKPVRQLARGNSDLLSQHRNLR
jgi:hypothetical protein